MTTPKALREMCGALENAILEMISATKAQAENQSSREAIERMDASTEAFDEIATDENLLSITRALLDRPSGEAVTRPTIVDVLKAHAPIQFVTDIERVATALVSLLPAGMDRNAVVEECAAVCVDLITGNLLSCDDALGTALDAAKRAAWGAAARDIRALKSS